MIALNLTEDSLTAAQRRWQGIRRQTCQVSRQLWHCCCRKGVDNHHLFRKMKFYVIDFIKL